jgi:zinc transport system ATP-binding protein
MMVVELEEVNLRLNGVHVLENITLDIPAGDFVALIGQNGAGKTTLIKVILGLLRPRSGEVRLFGQDVRGFKDWRRIGYIPQHSADFDSRFPASVWEIAALGRVPSRGLLRPLSGKDRGAVNEALRAVGMTAMVRRRIGELSGGERQRVLIARALASEPDLLLLDEPTSGVDPGMQEEVYDFLKSLNEERGLTILLATHDLGAVLRIAKTVACINRRLVCHRSMGEGLTAEELVATYGSSLEALTHMH